jgi:hypothetical protein
MLAKMVEDGLAISWLGLDFIIADGEVSPPVAQDPDGERYWWEKRSMQIN